MVKAEPGCLSSTKETRRKSTTLITFNENRKPQNNGDCKLKIDLLSNALKIEPKDESFKDITAIFDWKFIRSKNILFVFANFDFQDFVLVFKTEEICNKVFNGIFKNRDVDSVENGLLKERFLNPLLKNASRNLWMKQILDDWIQQLDEKEKNENLKLLKWHQQNPEINGDEIDMKDVKVEIEPLPETSRKRKHGEIGSNVLSDSTECVDQGCDDNSHESQLKTKNASSADRFTKIVEKSKFEILNFKTPNRIRRKLLIFTSADKKQCYEFKLCRSKQVFIHRCRENSKKINAILDIDENGKECIKMEDKKHRCSPIVYEEDKYSQLKILKKPEYEILENCATRSKSKRMLIIFDQDERNQCYEYVCRLSTFYCYGCVLKGKGNIKAEIIHENTVTEYVVLSHEEHICEKSIYNPEKYFSVNQFVLSPNFEFQMKSNNNGTNRKTLIIFAGNDRKYCHTYFCVKNSNIFYCNGCRRKQTNVSAKIYKNDENEEYVILSNKKHVCSPRIYAPQKEIIILRPPKFKFMEATEMQKSKLFIFDSSDPKLCYTFSSEHKGDKRYCCLGCILVAQQKNKTNANKCRQTKQVVSVYLQKDDGPNGEYFVQINAGEKHICQPQKYEPEKYEIKVLKPRIDYVLFRNKGRNGNVNLVIYHPDDKHLCYKYYKITSTAFQCPGCFKKNTRVTAKLHQDLDGNEYLTINEKKHVCDPIEYSSIIKSNTVILKKSGLAFEEPKEKEIDEKRIVQLPKFELQRNRLGAPERRLIIFFDYDQKLCYDYRYGKDQFLCKKCNVTAKIKDDEKDGNGKYVILSKNKHKCEPVKYEPEKEIVENRIIRIPNFELQKNGFGIPERRMILFFDEDRKLCYDYFYRSGDFVCKKCNITAKLKVDEEDGNEKCVILSKNKHKCQPMEFTMLRRKC